MVDTQPSPEVSVIIPTYNRCELLARAVDSVLKQTYYDLEIIVADDGSTLGRADDVARFDERIRYLRLEHSGFPGLVRNRGIGRARGKIIAFLDDDDTWEENKLTRQIALLDSEPAIGFVYSDVRFANDDGSVSDPILRPHQKHPGSLLHHLLRDCFIYPSTVLVRRSCLERVGLFDETRSPGEDYDLWLRLAHAYRAGCIPEPLTLIRRHPSGISEQSEILTYKNSISVLERFLATTPLSLHQKLRGRTSLSRWYVHIGLAETREGRLSAARRHFLHSLRLKPLQRRAWSALVRSYVREST